jgi:hypothetical protein
MHQLDPLTPNFGHVGRPDLAVGASIVGDEFIFNANIAELFPASLTLSGVDIHLAAYIATQ